jgi:TolB-like protein/Flp pilus assembly protein TadD
MSLIAELRRRNVFRVGVAYAVVAWLLVEVASVVLPTFKTPEWVMQAFIFLVVLGFPLALIFAWAFELTPDGIKRESEVDRAESITRLTGRKLDFAIIGLLVLAVVFLVVDNYVLKADVKPAEQSSEAALDGKPVAHAESIAVLPFANRSSREEDAFFVDGMHDDILTHLAKIRSLKVISRTSVMEYRNTNKNLKTIGRELGAATLLEGGVQRAGNQVRINVQLIDAETDEHLWANIYDRELTAANIFAIQTEIATAIADALRAALSPEEEQRLAAVPTEDLAAYEAYLLGKQLLEERRSDSYAAAIEHFQDAIARDPEFALAYVGMSEAYNLQAFYTDVPREETLEKSRVAAEKALLLNDQLGEAYTVLAAYKQDTYDYAGAEEAFKRAIQLSPNYARAYHWYGWMLRHILGRPDEALALHERAVELDPRSGVLLNNIAGDLNALGRFDEASEWIALAIERDPDYPEGEESIGNQSWLVRGRLDEAVVHYAKAISLDPNGLFFLRSLGFVYLDLGGIAEATHWIQRLRELGPNTFVSNDGMAVLQLALGDESAALESARKAIALAPAYLQPFMDSTRLLRDHELRAGRVSEIRGLYEKCYPELLSRSDPAVSRANYEGAIGLAMVALRTDEPAYADLLLQRSLEVLQQVPRLGAFGYGVADARIYALRGENQKALAALRRAIDERWRGLWWYSLEHDLALEPLHGEPEYQAMIAEIRAEMAQQLARVREMENNGDLKAGA